MSAPRALPLALGFFLAALCLPAEEALPSLFNPAALIPPAASRRLTVPEPIRPPLPLSAPIREALNQRAVAATALAPATTPSMPRTLDAGPDTIVLERIVVTGRREKKAEVESVPGYLIKAFETGAIFRSAHPGALSPDVYWGLAAVTSTGYGAHHDTPRVELTLDWRW